MPAILKKDLSTDSADGVGADSGDSQISTEPPLTQIKNLMEKKIRNLEKRKTKLDQYKADLQDGKTLTEEQMKAMERICDVEQQIESTKELQKNVCQIIHETNRQQKAIKQKEYKEKCETEMSKLRQLLAMQEILYALHQENVRQDFVSGRNGAVKLSDEEFAVLNYVYTKICPPRENTPTENVRFSSWSVYLQSSAQFVHSLLNCSSKTVPDKQLTYKDVRLLMDKISTCEYFHNKISRCQSPEQAKSDSSSVNGDCNNGNGEISSPNHPASKQSTNLQNEFNGLSVTATKPEEVYFQQQQQSSPYCNECYVSNHDFIRCPSSETLDFVAPRVDMSTMAAYLSHVPPPPTVPSGNEIFNAAPPVAFCNGGQESLAFMYAQQPPFVNVPGATFVDSNFAHLYPAMTSMENACQLSPIGQQSFYSTGYTPSKPLDPNAPSFISRVPVNWIPVVWPANHTFRQEISSEEANQTFDALQEIADIGITDPTTEESILTATSGSLDETNSAEATNDAQQCYEDNSGDRPPTIETLIADFTDMTVRHPSELELLANHQQTMQSFCPQIPQTTTFQPNYHTLPHPSLWYGYGLQTFGPPCV